MADDQPAAEAANFAWWVAGTPIAAAAVTALWAWPASCTTEDGLPTVPGSRSLGDTCKNIVGMDPITLSEGTAAGIALCVGGAVFLICMFVSALMHE